MDGDNDVDVSCWLVDCGIVVGNVEVDDDDDDISWDVLVKWGIVGVPVEIVVDVEVDGDIDNAVDVSWDVWVVEWVVVVPVKIVVDVEIDVNIDNDVDVSWDACVVDCGIVGIPDEVVVDAIDDCDVEVLIDDVGDARVVEGITWQSTSPVTQPVIPGSREEQVLRR